MAKAVCVPEGYKCLDLTEQSESEFPNEACAMPSSVFYAAIGPKEKRSELVVQGGWRVVVYDTDNQQAEDEEDVKDSLEALNEPPGTSLEEFREELGV